MPYEQSTFASHLHVIEKRKRGETVLSDVYAPTHLSDVTLADLIPMSMEVGFKEEEHMQPVLIVLLSRQQWMLFSVIAVL